MSNYAQTQAIADARLKKARKLASQCRKLGIPHEKARLLDLQGRYALAGLAAVKAPSDETWALMCALLKGRK